MKSQTKATSAISAKRLCHRLLAVAALILGCGILSQPAHAGWRCCWTTGVLLTQATPCDNEDACNASMGCFHIRYTQAKTCGPCLLPGHTCETVWIIGTRWYEAGNCNFSGPSGCACFPKKRGFTAQTGPYTESCI